MTLCDLLHHIPPSHKVRVYGYMTDVDYGVARGDVWIYEESDILDCNVNFIESKSRFYIEIYIYDD